MEPAPSLPPTPIRWLAASNIMWLLAGLLAYTRSLSLVVGTALALVPALPGLLDLKRSLPDEGARQWMDRAVSFAIAGWAILAVMVIIPYIASEEGLSLWASRGFTGLGLAAASLSMLLWNASAFQGLTGDAKSMRLYAAFHAAIIVVALYLFAQAEPETITVMLRGHEIIMPDPRLAAGIAAAPGLLWALVMSRARIEPNA